MQSAGLGRLAQQDGFSNYGSNVRKNQTFDPNPIVDVGRPVSRVEMNAKNAPLTPASPHRCFPAHFLRPRAVKNALTRPTLSYMALHFRASCEKCGLVPRSLFPSPSFTDTSCAGFLRRGWSL